MARITEIRDPDVIFTTSGSGSGGGTTGQVDAANSATTPMTDVQRVQPLDATGAIIDNAGLATEATLATRASESTLASVVTAIQATKTLSNYTLLNAVTTPGAGASQAVASNSQALFQIIITGVVTVYIQVSLDNTNWVTIDGPITGSQGVTSCGPFRYARAVYSAGTGTATVLCSVI